MGLYKIKDCIYYQLRVLNRLLDSRRVADEIGMSEYKERIFMSI